MPISFRVSKRALIKRINRKLKEKEQKLIKREDGYHIIDPYRNISVRSNVDLQYLGRELGALGAGEFVEK